MTVPAASPAEVGTGPAARTGPASPAGPPDGDVATALASARRAFGPWSRTPLSRRLAVLRRFRQGVARDAADVAAALGSPTRSGPGETLVAEVGPLLDAVRFVERRAGDVLRRRRPERGRPSVLAPTLVVDRLPHGVVLVLGASNYPLMLPGVQVVQALAAGNAVALKPGAGGTASARFLLARLTAAGLPPDALTVLPEGDDAGRAAIAAGVDFVALTGSAATGRRVLAQLAGTITPSVMELSGHDAAFVLPGADVAEVGRALAFGLAINGGATCIAPRRAYVVGRSADDLAEWVGHAVGSRWSPPTPDAAAFPPRREAWRRAGEAVAAAVERGATVVLGGVDPGTGALTGPTIVRVDRPDPESLATDVFAPVLFVRSVPDVDAALAEDAAGPYRLGASVFGPPDEAARLADRLTAGCVTVGDVVAPTADPRLAFGGSGASGFGVTRGAAGLLAMTRARTTILPRGRSRPHLDPPRVGDDRLLAALIRLRHAGTPGRWLAALGTVVWRGIARRKAPVATGPDGAHAPPAPGPADGADAPLSRDESA